MTKSMVQCLAPVVFCFCFYSYNALAQTIAPEDPNQVVTGEQYITPNLVEDPLTWSGPSSQGDCTYRPSGHGTWANDPRHSEGTWSSNPAYRSCPQISADGIMRFSWRPEENMALTNNIDNTNPIIAPYADALAEAGIAVNGYNYSWTIKSADVNNLSNTVAEGPYDKKGLGYSQDLLSITVEFIGEENQDVVWSKEYEYNYRISNWQEFSGNETFELNGADFEKIRITVDGYDAGYWAGYFGPEVRDVQFQLIFTVEETYNCDEDPLSSPTCYGYQDAFNQSIGLPTQAEMLAALESDYGGVDTTGQGQVNDFFDDGMYDDTSFEYNEEIEAGIEVLEQEDLQAFEQEQETQQTGVAVDDGQSTGVSSEESTGVADPVEEAVEEAIEESVEEASGTSVNGLSVAQGAEASANVVADSAIALATGAATAALNGDIATSTSLNQQSQQQSSSQGSNVEVTVNGSSNGNSSFGSNSSGSITGAFDNTDPTTGLSVNIAGNNSNQLSSNSQFESNAFGESDQSVFAAEFELASLDQNIIDDAINSVITTMLLLQNEAEDNFKEDTSDEGQLTAEEEEALVAAAQSGDDSEDAQAALLGYNPDFRAYQTSQIQDSQFYVPKEIYGDQENYDNPNQRFFNGASDATHREMVRQQYRGKND